jgi:hypothetical protein
VATTEGDFAMKVYHSMTMQEFIAELRDVAIKAGAGTLFLDKLDEIARLVELGEELESAE